MTLWSHWSGIKVSADNPDPDPEKPDYRWGRLTQSSIVKSVPNTFNILTTIIIMQEVKEKNQSSSRSIYYTVKKYCKIYSNLLAILVASKTVNLQSTVNQELQL